VVANETANATEGGGVKIEIYKRGQGKYTRTITFLAVLFLGVVGAVVLSGKLMATAVGAYVAYGVPVGAVAVLAVFMFWMVNRPRSADFLIATEGEIKKVSWSSRKEVIGSTKVVIITTIIMAALLFTVDILFKMVFNAMGIWD